MAECLIYNRTDNAKTLYDVGDFVVIMPAGHGWGAEERLPKFLQIEITDRTPPQMGPFLEKWVDPETLRRVRLRTQHFDVDRINPPSLREGSWGYGYLWWVFQADTPDDELTGAYTSWGAFGQYITVIPRLDLVVVHKVRTPPYNQNVPIQDYLRMLRLIIAAAQNSPRGS